MGKQIRAITFARIVSLLKYHEEDHKELGEFTLELRSNGSGSIINLVKTPIITWDDINDLNEHIKTMTSAQIPQKKQKYNDRYYRGR